MAAERQKETGAWPMLKHNAKGWYNEVVRHQSPPLLGCAALEFAAKREGTQTTRGFSIDIKKRDGCANIRLIHTVLSTTYTNLNSGRGFDLDLCLNLSHF